MADGTTVLLVKLEAQFDQFQRSMAKLNGDVVKTHRNVESNFAKISESAKGLGKGLLLGLGGGVLFAGLEEIPEVLKRVVDKVAQIGVESEKIGLPTDQLQQLRLMGEQAGIGIDAVDSALEKFSKNIGLAAHGFGDLLPDLKANNIALTDAAGKQRPLNDLIRDFANLIRNAKSPQDAAVLATRAFGRAGEDLIPVLKGGADAIDRFQESASRTSGKIISPEDIERARELKERFDELTAVVTTFIESSLVEFADTSVREFERIAEGAEKLRKILSEPPADQVNEWKQQIELLREQIQALQAQAADGINIRIETAQAEAQIAELQRKIAGAQAAVTGRGTFTPNSLDKTKDDRELAPSAVTPTVITNKPLPHHGGSDPQKSFDKEIDAIHKRTAALAAETATLGQGIAVQERAKIEAELFTSAQDKGLISAKQFKTVEDLLGASLDTLTPKQARLREQILSTSQAYAQAAAQAADAKQQQDLLFQSQQAFAEEGESGIERLIVDHEKLGDVLQDTIKWLEAAALKAALLGQGPLASLFGTAQAASAGGNGLGGLLGSLFGGFKAGGGNVEAGRAYVVGEKRPEIFVPRSPGRIVPDASWGNGSVGDMHIHVDLTGANGDAAIAFAAEQASIRGAQRAISQVRRSGASWASEDQARYA